MAISTALRDQTLVLPSGRLSESKVHHRNRWFTLAEFTNSILPIIEETHRKNHHGKSSFSIIASENHHGIHHLPIHHRNRNPWLTYWLAFWLSSPRLRSGTVWSTTSAQTSGVSATAAASPTVACTQVSLGDFCRQNEVITWLMNQFASL